MKVDPFSNIIGQGVFKLSCQGATHAITQQFEGRTSYVLISGYVAFYQVPNGQMFRKNTILSSLTKNVFTGRMKWFHEP